MRKIILTIAAVAAVGTAAIAPADARGFGRGAAIGAGIGAAALGAAVAAGAYNAVAAGAYNNGYYAPATVTATSPMTVITITPAITMMGRGCISGESTATTVTGKTEEPGFGRALSLFNEAAPYSRPRLRHAGSPRSM
jgi:hypothetical protein